MSTMHDDIPFDIQAEIMKRIPDVKSLIRFRSVSKSWKSLIDSSKFISAYKSTNHRLLVAYNKPSKGGCGYASVADDDGFSQHHFHHQITLPKKAESLVGTSQGLFCFYVDRYVEKQVKSVIIIWNPSIRKSVTFDAPDHSYKNFQVFGFGVCRRTSDPKLVYLQYYHKRFISAEIFTLSSGNWRSLPINPHNIISNIRLCFRWYDWNHKAVIDGILYLHGRTSKDNRKVSYNRIITFDFTSEEFGEVCLPDNLAPRLENNFSISKLNESLVVLERYRDHESQVCNVWIMEHGASKLFKKQFTINTPFFCTIKGFRMNGQAIIESKEVEEGVLRVKKGVVEVYDPCTGHFSEHEVSIDHFLFFMYSYTESLLLLDQSDSIVR